MALLFMDGFDHYDVADMPKKWTSVNVNAAIAVGLGRRGGNALNMLNGNSVSIKNFTAAQTVICGFAWEPVSNTQATANAGTDILDFMDTGSVVHLSLHPLSDGSLKVYRGETTALLGSSATGVITTGVYQYIEMKATIDDTAGAVEVRVNGVAVLTLTNVDTRNGGNASCNGIQIGGTVGSSIAHYFDDLYICDTSGTVNNNFLGDVRIEPFYPSGAGAHQDFTNSVTQTQLDATYTYWRVIFDQMSGGTQYVYEVEMRATVGGADQCSGGTPSGFGGSWQSITSLFDNNTGTYGYVVNAIAGSTGFQYQFASAVSVKELSWRGDSSTTYYVSAFRLQASNDGTNFIDIAAFTGLVWAASETKVFAVPSAAHYNSVNDHTTVDASSRYVTGGAAGTKETYTLTAAGSLPSSDLIVAVQVNNLVKKTDAGGAAVRNLVRSGTSEEVGATVALGTSNNYVRSLHELDPATGQPWLLSAVTAMQAGLDIVS